MSPISSSFRGKYVVAYSTSNSVCRIDLTVSSDRQFGIRINDSVGFGRCAPVGSEFEQLHEHSTRRPPDGVAIDVEEVESSFPNNRFCNRIPPIQILDKSQSPGAFTAIGRFQLVV